MPAGIKGVRIGYLENLIMNVLWIPIVSIVLGIGIAMLGVWTDHQRRSQVLEHQHRERMAAIEKGVPLPPTKLDVDAARTETKKADPARVLRSGVLMLGLGVVLYFAIDAAGGREGALFGLIPAMFGLANLAYAAVLFNQAHRADIEKTRDILPPQ
jgi:hypothetical protein